MIVERHPSAGEAPWITLAAGVSHNLPVDVRDKLDAVGGDAHPGAALLVTSDVLNWLVCGAAGFGSEPAPLFGVAAQIQVYHDHVADTNTTLRDGEALPCVLPAALLAERKAEGTPSAKGLAQLVNGNRTDLIRVRRGLVIEVLADAAPENVYVQIPITGAYERGDVGVAS